MLDSRAWALRIILCLGPASIATGQETDTLKLLAAQVQELRQTLEGIRSELANSQLESKDLQRQLQELRAQLGVEAPAPLSAGSAVAVATTLETLSEDQQVLDARVAEQYQTKVASGSKYRVRLSGLALFNAFHTSGTVDNIDLPRTATVRTPGEGNGSLGGSLRQSMLSLEVFGPEWKGAHTRGDLTFDFFGGFPATSDGLSTGLVRLRTANLALDWKQTSLIFGQDTPFFSPLSPRSLVSTAYPALSSSGNLWTWTPQVYVEHREALPFDAQLTIQGGILDALTGEPPAAEYNRTPTAGESSRMPAYAMHGSWQRSVGDRQLAFGAGGYYSRQDWGFQRKIDAWAATADWNIPFGPWLTLSGEFYRGRAIGGLGGGASGSVVFPGSPALAASAAVPLDSAGGWSQLKLKPQERIEFNIAFGEDSPFHSAVIRSLIDPVAANSPVSRNANGFLNVIYTARSNLLFSLEYRRLWTSYFIGPQRTADHVSIGAGIIF
jgi:hypothetical protein